MTGGDGKMGEKRRRKLFLFGSILTLILILRFLCFTNYMVEGKSMMPTLQEGNLLIVNKLSYQIGDIHRFDVIVFHANKKKIM